MEEFPGNARTPKRQDVAPATQSGRPKVEKVVSGPVVQRNRSLGKRFKETFISGDARTVGRGVIVDLLLPNVKEMVVTAITQQIEGMFFGESGRGLLHRTLSQNQASNSFVSYNRISGTPTKTSAFSQSRPDPRPALSHQARANHDFGEIVLATRVEAQEVIRRMDQLIERYESVSLVDLFEMLGINSEYTDDAWGWEDLSTAQVKRGRGGFLLDLPRPIALNR